MSTEDELRRTQEELAEVSGGYDDVQRARLLDAERRAQLHAEELLHCAMTIVELTETPQHELDVALQAVNNKAEEVGLLRRQPLRTVAPKGQDGPAGT